MKLRLLALLSFLAACFAAPAPASAQEGLRLVEQDIKAGLLYNFLRYTEWPGQQSGNIVVCLYGGDPFGGRLAPMAGRTVNQRTIEIRPISAVSQTNSCALLFVNGSQRAHWAEVRTHLANANVLTVSDFEGFADAGGMIEFARIERRIGVRINTAAVRSAGLVVQDRLLQLASSAGAPQNASQRR